MLIDITQLKGLLDAININSGLKFEPSQAPIKLLNLLSEQGLIVATKVNDGTQTDPKEVIVVAMTWRGYKLLGVLADKDVMEDVTARFAADDILTVDEMFKIYAISSVDQKYVRLPISVAEMDMEVPNV